MMSREWAETVELDICIRESPATFAIWRTAFVPRVGELIEFKRPDKTRTVLKVLAVQWSAHPEIKPFGGLQPLLVTIECDEVK